MFVIGLIEDEESEQAKIRRTIKVINPNTDRYGFKTYDIPKRRENAINILSQEVIKDIENRQLTALIIDYKIMVEKLKLKGTDILKHINEDVPKFPVIILTEIVNESKQSDYVDADKVYSKKEFFKLEDKYSKEKVSNIFDSMEKYVRRRDSLTTTLKDLKKQLSEGQREVIPDILKLEEQLDAYIPVNQTTWDRVYNMDKMQEVIDKLEEANRMLE